jgi:hypothetical protein
LGVFGRAAHLVELDAQRVGHQADRLAEDRRAVCGHRLQVRVVDRLAEADRLLGRRGVVERGVGGFDDADFVDPVAHHRRHDGQQFGEAGADAGSEDRRAALLAGFDDPVAALAEVGSGDERRRRHHVDARRQDADQLVDVDPHGVVDHAVRLEGEQRVDVVGGGDAQRGYADQLAGVAADLLR